MFGLKNNSEIPSLCVFPTKTQKHRKFPTISFFLINFSYLLYSNFSKLHSLIRELFSNHFFYQSTQLQSTHLFPFERLNSTISIVYSNALALHAYTYVHPTSPQSSNFRRMTEFYPAGATIAIKPTEHFILSDN